MPNARLTNGLLSGFLRSVEQFPERPALDVEGQVLSYGELFEAAAATAHTLQQSVDGNGTPCRIGVLAQRSLAMYQGLLGTLLAGHTLVPLNPGFPTERTLAMAEQADLSALLVDHQGLERLDDLLRTFSRPLVILLPDAERLDELQAHWPGHGFRVIGDSNRPSDWVPAAVSPDDLACLFFTSGSTGIPKGVGVLQRNAARFVEMSLERYRDFGIDETDRFSQFYDITFDSSMFDLYVSWAFGACLCCPSAKEWFNPNRYIADKALTVIDITPSAGHGMNRRNGWAPGRFPDLRLCRFGGEALSAELAEAMAAAAPKAWIDNAYGPTECTVDACFYRWDPAQSPTECEHGMVPIGYPGNQVKLRVAGEALKEVPVGSEGELLISGPQVTPGYWKDPERTAQAFVHLDDGRVHYRTGDLVRRPGPGEPIIFLGRLDHQIKIGGVRIELGEVEAALREAAGTDQAVAVGWPRTESGASGIVAFVVGDNIEEPALRDRLRQRLPAVMVPRAIHATHELPLNANGKVDRKALIARLDADAG
ncbi:amino acid adenylation domain-containing protein [Thioalkalivibrio sp. ALE17]|uniref:amino acid adenylation domain-containing protein n=1 Tax=Thioalkalivibrio sp. ALE17 TaxID=1158173 RepID=UPI000490ECE1|nr:amino acid adenylation domain-containing protein [Thioalkalivibrio sp. ALE17]